MEFVERRVGSRARRTYTESKVLAPPFFSFIFSFFLIGSTKCNRRSEHPIIDIMASAFLRGKKLHLMTRHLKGKSTRFFSHGLL